jgi:hypothetical protein
MKHGKKTPIRLAKDRADKWWRAVVRLLYGGRCALRDMPPKTGLIINMQTGKTESCFGGLEAHHIKGKQSHPHLRFDPANGILLCSQHHALAHSDWKAVEEWLEANHKEAWMAIQPRINKPYEVLGLDGVLNEEKKLKSLLHELLVLLNRRVRSRGNACSKSQHSTHHAPPSSPAEA